MKLNLHKKPKNPTIIIGFPGMGLVGPIVTEFLIEHMRTEKVGEFVYDDLPPTVAVHKGELVHPMSLHYSEKYNILIIYTLLNVQGKEWDLAKEIFSLAKETDSKEILCIDGANTVGDEENSIYYFGNESLKEHGAKQMKESVITGVTGALLLKDVSVSCIFAAVNMQMPNAMAASNIVKFLDSYLGLEVDAEPLVQQAQEFENKLKNVMDQSKKLRESTHQLDYLG